MERSEEAQTLVPVEHSIQSGIFGCLIYSSSPTLGDVIRDLNWGSNRIIRESGFKIDKGFSEDSPFFSTTVRNMEVFKDPKLVIEDGWAVLVKKGDKVAVVRVRMYVQEMKKLCDNMVNEERQRANQLESKLREQELLIQELKRQIQELRDAHGKA